MFELKLYTAKLPNLGRIIKELGENLVFRIKIQAGKRFWTSSAFIPPKQSKKGLMLEFKQNYRVRVDLNVVDDVTISLWACAAEEGKLPEILKNLEKEERLGFVKISLKNVVPQKKVAWIPFNNKSSDDPFMTEGSFMVSMNYKLLDNVSN